MGGGACTPITTNCVQTKLMATLTDSNIRITHGCAVADGV